MRDTSDAKLWTNLTVRAAMTIILSKEESIRRNNRGVSVTSGPTVVTFHLQSKHPLKPSVLLKRSREIRHGCNS